MAYILRDTFHKCLAKLVSVETALFPAYSKIPFLSYDRENYKNTRILRELFRGIIRKRK